MRTISVVFVSAATVIACVAACGGSNSNQPAQAPSAQPYATGYPPPGQPGYPPPGQPGYPPPGQYPAQPQPGYPAPGQTAAPPGAPAAGQLAVPGPMAFPCTTDAQCGTHKCNTQYGKCAHPCQSDFDCIQGATCLGAGQPLATCVPKPPGSP